MFWAFVASLVAEAARPDIWDAASDTGSAPSTPCVAACAVGGIVVGIVDKLPSPRRYCACVPVAISACLPCNAFHKSGWAVIGPPIVPHVPPLPSAVNVPLTHWYTPAFVRNNSSPAVHVPGSVVPMRSGLVVVAALKCTRSEEHTS